MATIPDTAKKRFKNRLDKAKKRIADARKKIMSQEEILDLFKFIANKVYGFNLDTEIVVLPDQETSFPSLEIQLDGEIALFINVTSPNTDLSSEGLDSAIQYATKQHVQWFTRTNGRTWKLYRANWELPKQYDLVSAFNFLEMDPKSDRDIDDLYLLCREKHAKVLITDQYNKARWWGYLSQDKAIIEHLFLLNICVYEGGSERAYIPLLDITYWSDESFTAQTKAKKAIDLYLKDECGKEYDIDHQFESVAYHKETRHLVKDNPAWQ